MAEVVLQDVGAASRAPDLVAVHQASAERAYAHIFDGPFPRAAAHARWSGFTGHTVLATRDGAAIGFAAASADGVLEGLYVVPDESGSGLGSALLDAVGPVSRLWVLEQNTAGRGFYERRGWNWSGTQQAAADAGGAAELLYVTGPPGPG